jgi:hypothetical protein
MTEWDIDNFRFFLNNWNLGTPDIASARNVIYINLNNAELNNLPDQIFSNFNNLQSLELQGNQLISLPESIGSLRKLEILELEGNQLTSLPESIGNLTNLRQLFLSENQLTSLPESIGNLTNLIRLNISNNQISSLPESIGNLINLEELSFSDNRLTSIPDSIGNLQNLQDLDLGFNRFNGLSSLPESIGNLQNLTNLDLGFNRLVSLPESIGNIENLDNLILVENNELTTIPQSLIDLYNRRAGNLVIEADNNIMMFLTPQEVAGVAYEVHNAFNKIDIQQLITFLNNKIRNPIEEEEWGDTEDFFLFIQQKITNFVNELDMQILQNVPPKPLGYYPDPETTYTDIWRILYSRIENLSFDKTEKQLIISSITYASEQSKIFKENYVLSYLNDTAFAYTTGNTLTSNFSCGKGMKERFVTSLVPAIDAMETLGVSESKGEEETITSEKLKEYKILKGIIKGGFDQELALQLIKEWLQNNDNKYKISNEEGKFKENKEQLITEQRQNLIEYLCCELTVTETKLLQNRKIKESIDYMFTDDGILDNTLGGKTKKNKNKKKRKGKTKKRMYKKTKRNNKNKKNKRKHKTKRV